MSEGNAGLHGRMHKDLLAWLRGPWLTDGPTISVIQGFPGVGKTRVARDFVATLSVPRALVELPDGEGVSLDDVLLDAAADLEATGRAEVGAAIQQGTDLVDALGTAMRSPMVLVIDEFQRAFREKDAALPAPIARLLGRLASQQGRGRLLLLSSQRIDGTERWAEHAKVHSPLALAADDARRLLDQMLTDAGRDAEVPADRRDDLVRWLGRNPRAMRLLVAGLHRDALDDLIGLELEAWEVRDREVSPELLLELERKLLARVLTHQDAPVRRLLRDLSVYRKPFDRHAIDAQLPSVTDGPAQRKQLVDRFLLDHARGWFSLHPIAREIGLGELKADEAALRVAQGKAADHYTRHFKATQLPNVSALGGHFVEARYHLVNAGREAELEPIVGRFQSHLVALYQATSPVPASPAERDERIAVLTAFLHGGGPKGLGYYLARMLHARGHGGDAERALEAVRGACGPQAPAETWVLRMQLEAAVVGLDAALQAMRQGALVVDPTKNMFSLYQLCGELLGRGGRVEEAVTLLKEGIARVPATQSLFSLYQSCGELLGRGGRVDDAVALLKEGIARVPATQNLFSLYQSCGELLAGSGRADEAVTLLKEGIARVPAQSLSSLYQSCGELLAGSGRADEAVTLLKEGIARVPATQNLFSLYQSCGELLAGSGRADEAVTLLKEGIARVPATQSLFSLYQSCGELLGRGGRVDDAVALLKEGIARVPAQSLSSLYQSCGELLAGSGRADEAVTLLKEGIARVPATQNLFSLYQSCGELLAGSGRADEAVTLLKEGIARVPATQNLFSLYQSCGELLGRGGRVDDAVALLKEGIARVPAQSLSSLYQSCGELLAGSGRADEAVTLLKEGIARVPAQSLSSLYVTLSQIYLRTRTRREAVAVLVEGMPRVSHTSRYKLEESAVYVGAAEPSPELLDRLRSHTGASALEGPQLALAEVLRVEHDLRWAEAATIAARARATFPTSMSLMMCEAFCWLAAGDAARANEALARFPRPITFEVGSSNAWLVTFVALRLGDPRRAAEAFGAYLGRALAPDELPTEAELIRIWCEPESAFGMSPPGYFFPHLPPSLTGRPSVINHPQVTAPQVPARQSAPTVGGGRPARLVVLAIATEWSSGHGGLSTFNRELCLAWAKARPTHRVMCLVPTAPSAEEVRSARDGGVELVAASAAHGLSEEARLSIRPELPDGVPPSIVIGHGRVTGPAASAQAAAFPGSRRAHVVHVAPDEIEYFKDLLPGQSATQKAEERTRHDVERAASADVAVAVGPRLTRVLGNELHAVGKQLVEIVPGLPDLQAATGRPPALRCLVLGRAEDYELKGLDIAARALALVDLAALESQPSLVVRGAPKGTGDALRDRLLASAGRPGLQATPREYTSDAARIVNDLLGSCLLLMPSRAEGFGLVGLEAIAVGVPVLLSDQSGLGELIRQRCPDLARFHVVAVTGDLATDAVPWARAIERVLSDPTAAFARAQELRASLAPSVSWERTVAALLTRLGA